MNKLNKIMLVCNIILIILLVAAVFSACTSNSKVQWLEQQVNSLTVALQSVQNDLNAEKAKIAYLEGDFGNFKSQAENNFKSIEYYINILLNK